MSNRAAPTEFEWTVSHPCAFALNPNDVSIEGIPDRHWIRHIDLSDDALKATKVIRATIAFADKKEVPYYAQLFVKEGEGESVPLGGPVSVRVGWTTPDYAEFYVKRAGTIVVITHTVLFVLLLVGARWSAFCWRVLTDPVWGKTGAWFYFLLRHAGPVQRWVMARWFDAVRLQTPHLLYLPMSLSNNGEVVSSSDDLLDVRSGLRRLWVQGNAGMGKTTAVQHLQATFFADPGLPTLHAAFGRFGTIPIIVPLREYRHVAVDPGRPQDWVPSVARMAVSAFGAAFDDSGLFHAMIMSGGFLLVLDGANEVERDKEIELFARSAPAVRLLVMSQVGGSQYFTNWHLPRTIRDEIEPLLILFLREDIGQRVFSKIKDTSLLDAIRSGYDVRLLADLVEDQGPDVALPRDRVGLYQAILEAIRMPSGATFPDEILCKAAWTMWRDGDSKLETGKQLDEELLRPLISENQKVLRIINGQAYEFRHDQMRAYLAARWAACHEVQPKSLFESEDAIWRLSRKEQGEVWEFFADIYIVERPEDAIALWKWSTANPDRVELQHALQNVLTKEGHDPGMSRS